MVVLFVETTSTMAIIVPMAPLAPSLVSYPNSVDALLGFSNNFKLKRVQYLITTTRQ